MATDVELVAVELAGDVVPTLLLVPEEDVDDDAAPDDRAGARRGSPHPPVLGAVPGNVKPPADAGAPSI